MVRLIRSKGVGVYFVTQNPLDVPDKVLAQLGNRVQHALRAFTPRDQKAVKAAAETFRANPKLDTAKVITELGKGEALVSFLEGKGTPVYGGAVRDPGSAVGTGRSDHAGGSARRWSRAEPHRKASTTRRSTRESAYEASAEAHSIPAQWRGTGPMGPVTRRAGGGFRRRGVWARDRGIMDMLHTIFGTGQGRRRRLSSRSADCP